MPKQNFLQQHNKETRKKFKEWWDKGSKNFKNKHWSKTTQGLADLWVETWQEDRDLVWQFIETQNAELLRKVRKKLEEKKINIQPKDAVYGLPKKVLSYRRGFNKALREALDILK